MYLIFRCLLHSLCRLCGGFVVSVLSKFRNEQVAQFTAFAENVAEPLITLSKEDSVAKRRLAFDRLRDREVVTKLFNELGPRYKSRNGGYLRILKCGFRAGDTAPMAYVELVDRPQADEMMEA